MAFFIEFLKTSGLFENWVKECPLRYSSANAPHKRDVLGTILLSVLAGHWRYAHISALRGDGVNPELLGMTKVASVAARDSGEPTSSLVSYHRCTVHAGTDKTT